MAQQLSDEQLQLLREKLEQQRKQLLHQVHEELVQTGEAGFIELAGRVHDSADEAAATLVQDVEIAIIQQHARELQAINSALERMDSGHYGICMDCGNAIDFKRLSAYPAAIRCLRCQEAAE